MPWTKRAPETSERSSLLDQLSVLSSNLPALYLSSPDFLQRLDFGLAVLAVLAGEVAYIREVAPLADAEQMLCSAVHFAGRYDVSVSALDSFAGIVLFIDSDALLVGLAYTAHNTD